MDEGPGQNIFPIIAASYASLSFIFFLFPALLRRSRPLPSKLLRIAHRGGARLYPENTLLAFRKSAPLSDMLQLDVCLTKDGVLAIHHDRMLTRTCGTAADITTIPFSSLPPLQPQIEMDFSQHPCLIKTVDEKIPSLWQFFRQFQGQPLKFNIQLKTGSLQALSQLRRVITKYNRVEDCLVGVVKPWQKELEKIFPQSHRFVSYGKLGKLVFFYLTGLLPFVGIHERALQIPLYSQGYYRMKLRSGEQKWKVELMFALLKRVEWLIRPLAWHLRRRGVLTFYWVLNSEEQFKRAEAAYASGIMTDDPLLLDAYLNRKSQKNDESH